MRYVLILILSLDLYPALGQVEVGFYPIQSHVSISTNSQRLIWADLRVQANTILGNVHQEPHLMLNVKRTSFASFYVGLGVNANLFNYFSDMSPLNGYTVDLGARIRPIANFQRFMVLFEVGPYINRNFDGGTLRAAIGLAYAFQRRGGH